MAVAALLLALALLLWVGAWRLQRRTGLPYARVRYDDASARRPERALVSHRHRLTGRPDYLLERDGALIPVEVKPTRRARQPYPGDVMQLAAYCLLVEEQQGHPPPYGLLRYAEATWKIPYDADLRQRLLDTLLLMDASQQQPDVPRSHEQPRRCAHCSQRVHCSQRLA